MRKVFVVLAAFGALAVAMVGVSLAQAGDKDGDWNAKAKLTGYEETPSTLSSPGKGSFRADLDSDRIRFTLRWEGLTGVTQAHIHFGARGLTGGVSAFLCGGGGKPACANGLAEGQVVASDVIGPATQGIAAMELSELLQAIRAGYAYVNVHTGAFPGGEIRGQIKAHGNKHKD